MPPTARPAVRTAAPKAVEGFAFGSLENYSQGGFQLPEGDYIVSFSVEMFQGHKADGTASGEPFLATVLYLSPMGDSSAEVIVKPYSMGSKAKLSWAPNPNTGKGVVAIPGSPAAGFNNQTNWAVLLKSLYDSGLPQDPPIFTSDISALDGIWVHMTNIPEPEERKNMQSTAKTGAAEPQQRKGSGMIAVVSQILDGGAPWEGGGGYPEGFTPPDIYGGGAAPAPAKAAQGRVAARPTPVAARPVAARPVAVPVEVAESADDELTTAANSAITTLLQTNPNGGNRLMFRTGSFKLTKESYGDEMAQRVVNEVFGSDQALDAILAANGYKLGGPNNTKVEVA